MQPDSVKEAAFFVWESFLNTPYLWGGDDPLAGVDCSGLVLEGLKSIGKVPREFDNTAAGLSTMFPKVDKLERGCLLFWGVPIRHVEIVWAVFDGLVLTIGASGGGSKTVDRAEAVKSNAYVKIRRATPNWVTAVNPF